MIIGNYTTNESDSRRIMSAYGCLTFNLDRIVLFNDTLLAAAGIVVLQLHIKTKDYVTSVYNIQSIQGVCIVLKQTLRRVCALSCL